MVYIKKLIGWVSNAELQEFTSQNQVDNLQLNMFIQL